MASTRKALEKLDQAKFDYHSRAWYSAEQAAWESIAFFSQSMDLATGRKDAVTGFRLAKQAIMEAKDFAGSHAATDPRFILRLAKSHQTKLISTGGLDGLTASRAADQYLDFARRNLAPLAASDPQCAEAIDFLAAVYLKKDTAGNMAHETALCLRRAALQGQPNNADLAARLGVQLADIGLIDEAVWAIQHSLELRDDPRLAARLQRLMHPTTPLGPSDGLQGSFSKANDPRLPGPSPDHSLARQHDPFTNHQRFEVFDALPPQPFTSPVITRLSPSQFASISKPTMPTHGRHTVNRITSQPTEQSSRFRVPASLASARRIDNASPRAETANPVDKTPARQASEQRGNFVTRWFRSLKKW